jgi:hypothetical protein
MGMVLLTLGWIFSWAKTQQAEERAVTLDAELQKTEIELEKTRKELAKRENDLVELIQHRTPGLKEIEYNKLLEINDEYLSNLTFSESGVGESKALEYHALLVNEGEAMLSPEVKLIVFDEFGLQVGAVKVSKEHATSHVPLSELEPGEARSYHSQIPFERDAAPRYYMVIVQ